MTLKQGDLGYLCRKYRPMNLISLEAKFELLMNEFIRDIGLGKQTDEYYEKLKERQEYQFKYIHGDRTAYSFVQLLNNEIDQIVNKKVKEELSEIIADLSKYQGYRLNIKKTSVKEFYSIINNINNDTNNKK